MIRKSFDPPEAIAYCMSYSMAANDSRVAKSLWPGSLFSDGGVSFRTILFRNSISD